MLQLPETTERELSTQIRIRPGDSLLIAGLVRETDEFDSSGPGFDSPLIPTSRAGSTTNTELVFLLKPRVIVYTEEDEVVTSDDIIPSVEDDVSVAAPEVSSETPIATPLDDFSGEDFSKEGLYKANSSKIERYPLSIESVE